MKIAITQGLRNSRTQACTYRGQAEPMDPTQMLHATLQGLQTPDIVDTSVELRTYTRCVPMYIHPRYIAVLAKNVQLLYCMLPLVQVQ